MSYYEQLQKQLKSFTAKADRGAKPSKTNEKMILKLISYQMRAKGYGHIERKVKATAKKQGLWG